MFRGVITASITPFQDDKIDVKAMHKLIEYQIKGQVDGMVIAGSTGEGITLTFDEYKELLTIASSYRKDMKIIAAATSASTSQVIEMAKAAEDIGVDGFMFVVPFYNRPPQAGLIQHFSAIHDATTSPIMLYNVPARTSADITDDSVIALSKLPRIRALKDAGSDMSRPLRLKAALGNKIDLLTGNDDLFLAYCSQGGSGVVSVISNVIPSEFKALERLISADKYAEALEMMHELLPLIQSMSQDTNPIPIKFAASLLKLCSSEMRLPLCQMNERGKKIVTEAMF